MRYRPSPTFAWYSCQSHVFTFLDFLSYLFCKTENTIVRFLHFLILCRTIYSFLYIFLHFSYDKFIRSAEYVRYQWFICIIRTIPVAQLHISYEDTSRCMAAPAGNAECVRYQWYIRIIRAIEQAVASNPLAMRCREPCITEVRDPHGGRCGIGKPPAGIGRLSECDGGRARSRDGARFARGGRAGAPTPCSGALRRHRSQSRG